MAATQGASGALLSIAVHNGTFHTDDVFACATLSLAYLDRDIEITRTRDEAIIAAAHIVVDVGGVYDPETQRFDHHQKGGAGVRDNGVPYASFGLVWRQYGQQLAGSAEHANFIDEALAQGIDAMDNGYEPAAPQPAGLANGGPAQPLRQYAVGEIISGLRPTWQEATDIDEAFMEAVNLAMGILSRMIAHAKAYSEAAHRIEQAYAEAADKRIIMLDREYPGWQEALQQHPEPLYIAYEREHGGWSAKGVPIAQGSFALRKPFPEAWAGLRDEALQEATGVEDAIFCHNGRFIVAAGSKDGIVRVINKSLE